MASNEENRARYRRFVEELFNKGNYAVIDEMIAPDAIDHLGEPGVPPREGLKQRVAMFRAAFSDFSIEVVDQVAEGNTLANRLVFHGRHTGTLMGVPATGRTINVGGMDFVHLRDGMVAEHWAQLDMAALMGQLRDEG